MPAKRKSKTAAVKEADDDQPMADAPYAAEAAAAAGGSESAAASEKSQASEAKDDEKALILSNTYLHGAASNKDQLIRKLKARHIHTPPSSSSPLRLTDPALILGYFGPVCYLRVETVGCFG